MEISNEGPNNLNLSYASIFVINFMICRQIKRFNYLNMEFINILPNINFLALAIFLYAHLQIIVIVD